MPPLAAGFRSICSLGILLSACAPEAIPTPGTSPDAAVAPASGAARLLILRSTRWPGGGREFTVGVLDAATGRPFAEDLSPRITVTPAEAFTVEIAAARRALPPGYTAVLLPPAVARGERAALAKAVADFAAARPADERIALYRHGAAVQSFAGFLRARDELGEALARYSDGTDDPAPLPLDDAVDAVVDDLHAVGGEGPDVMRSLIVLAGDPAVVDVDVEEAFVVAAPPAASGLSRAAEAIDDVRGGAYYRVAACSRPEKFEARFAVTGLMGSRKASLSATLPEEIGAACDPRAIDSSTRTYTPRIELVFDELQRAAHEARIRATQMGSFNEVLARSDFETGVRLAPGQPVVRATAHLRGQGSLRCERKSYTVRLDGPERYLLPDSATDEFHLISMCDDPGYVFAPTAYDLVGEDVFPLQQRFIELVVNGRTRGIYLLVEKVREELVRDNARTTVVLRRGFPKANRDSFAVEYSATGNLVAPLQRYADFETRMLAASGDDLIAVLREHLDLEQYLRWLATQSIFKSGDYIDESFFTGVEQADGLGAVRDGYRITAWDPEGYTTCHLDGQLAYVDPHGMAYCAESRLDHKLLADPKTYALFAARVANALEGRLTRDRFAEALGRTRARLQALLVEPAICAAMTELRAIDPRSADCAVARAVVAGRAAGLQAAYDDRRTFLLDRLKAYRPNP